MRIMFLSNTDSLYGANRSMIELIKYLKSMGDDVIVLLPVGGEVIGELEKIGCEYHVVNYKTCVRVGIYNTLGYFTNIRSYLKLLGKIRYWNIDIIHSNTSVLDIGAWLAYSLKIPHVWHVRETLEHYHMKYITPHLYKKLREKSNSTIYISQFLFENARKKYTERKPRVVYNGFDTSENIAYERNKSIEELPINLLVCGMITASKGQTEAVEATRILVQERGINVNLYLAGEVGGRGDAEALKQKIQECDVESYVFPLGFLEDLSPIRSNTDIALQCSRLEGMGRVTVESMLSGIIVVGAASGATAELISDGENGYLYEPGNAVELADKIEYIVRHPEEKRRIEDRAKKMARQKFNSTFANEQIREIYKELLDEKRSAI